MSVARPNEAKNVHNQSKKEEIQAQLAKLNKQLQQVEAEERKQESNTPQVLEPASPSPRKTHDQLARLSGYSEKVTLAASRTLASRTASSANHHGGAQSKRPNSSDQLNSIVDTDGRPKSNLVQDLKALRQESKNQSIIQGCKRSTDFETRAERPSAPPPELRSLDLTVKVNIKLGPINFRTRKNDSDFLEYEPNSQIRLTKRFISHQALQVYLSDRYVVRINELYAIIKKVEISRFQSGNEWTIPLIGDWVLFGVIGQKSDFKTTNPHVASQVSRINNQTQEEGNLDQNQLGSSSTSKRKLVNCPQQDNALDDLNEQLELEAGKLMKPGINKVDGKISNQSDQQQQQTNKRGKKFVTFKLIDLTSTQISNSGSGVINMILFESDSYIPNGQESTNKTYKGGSGGAYEKFWKEQPGTLIGILNPKILKSRRPSGSTLTHLVHMNEILTITPESSKSLMIIGNAKDLGTCVAKRLDTGKECGCWCDLRTCNARNSKNTLAVCDFHLKRQVGKVRASRAEFFSGTSGMNTYTGKKFGTDNYDADSKTGLLPSQPKSKSIYGHKTYICGRGGANGVNQDQSGTKKMNFRDKFSEPIDVEKLEGIKLKRKRELEEIQMNKILKQQVEKKDNYGLKCIQDAKLALSNNKSTIVAGQTHQSTSGSEAQNTQLIDSILDEQKKTQPTRSIFSTAAIRAIGFDPFQSSSKGNKVSQDDEAAKNSSAAYDDLLNCHNKKINLNDDGQGNENLHRTSKGKLKTKDSTIGSKIKRYGQQAEEDDSGEKNSHQNTKIVASSQNLDQIPHRSTFKESKINFPTLVELSGSDDDDDDDDDLIVEPAKTS